MPPPVPLKSTTSSGTNNNNNRPRNAFPSNARIPLEYCDGPTQRLYAVSAFVLLQACKIVYWFSISQSDYAAEFFGFILWLSLDAAFLMALNYLRIPWLELPNVRLILALLLLTILNFVLFTIREVSPAAIARSSLSKVWGYTGSSSTSRGDNALLHDQDEHLLGRHTVLKKPYSTAIFNPEDRCYCVPDASLKFLEPPKITIAFNDSDPYTFEYSITSFETGLASTQKLTGPFKESDPVLRKFGSIGTVSSYNLTASTVGAYKIHRILDKEGVDIRFDHSKEVYVVPCPEAKIDQYNQSLEQCTGKGNVDIPIAVRGLPPWTVTYRRKSHTDRKDDQELQIDAEPIDYSSPFLPGWSKSTKQDYGWAKQHEMNLSVSLGLSTPGTYDFQVTRVKDGCGNVVELNSLVALGAREPEIRHVEVRDRPSVSMNCDPRKPIKIVKQNKAKKNSIRLAITRGTGPYRIGYVYQKTDLDEPEVMKDIVSDSKMAEIPADRPGLYTLSYIKDSFCDGEVELPRDCAVTVASLPTVDIVSHPINDSCVGAIGVTVDATFTGEGPWKVCYDVYRDNRLLATDVCPTSTKPRLNLDLKPDQSGNFEYRFKSVSDKNYGNQAVIAPPIFQNIHPQPSAKFRDTESLKTCKGSSADLDVELSGTGPWDIEYRIIRGTESQLLTLRNITKKSARLTLPPFEREGTYSVDLGKVTDLANGCQKDLRVSDVAVEVSPGPPTVAFQCEKPIEFAEGGSVDLSIHLTGGKPWRLQYGLEGGDVIEAMSVDRNALVTVDRPGVYVLKTVKDSFCEVMSSSKPNVAGERPTMNLKIDSIRFRGGPRDNVPEGEIAPSERISREGDHFVLPAVCKDSDRTLELRLTGKAPFTLKYTTIFKPAKGGPEVRSIPISAISTHATMRLPILTDRPGTVSYLIETISDATYSNVKVRHEKHAVVFKHVVRSPPTASLVSTAKQVYCRNEITGVKESVAFKIQDGSGPYSLAIQILRPNKPSEKFFEHDVVPTKNGIFEWKLPARFTEMGLHSVSVLKVTDVNGCSSGSESKVEFDILDTPSITARRQLPDTCVGEKIEFDVQGQKPPFKVHYTLDSTKHTEVMDSKSRVFTYKATKPGQLQIQKVCQTIERKECCTQSLAEMSTKIWAIPTVKIAGGRDDFITDLREDEQAEVVATFEGEPPFAWSYILTEAEFDAQHHAKHGGRHHRKPESKGHGTFQDILEHKFSFFTNAEGTIVPTYIRDKHCQFGSQ
ncbi:hypothetical protein BGZ83_000768 [Gryganskiella cystojenkinii]|nr:hypothetical protein BGZ83_000768 [Gryganskiella cystojenkinii]